VLEEEANRCTWYKFRLAVQSPETDTFLDHPDIQCLKTDETVNKWL